MSVPSCGAATSQESTAGLDAHLGVSTREEVKSEVK